MKRQRTVEMTGYGKRGKPNPGFPRFPQPLEIAARFPHSHSPDYQSFMLQKHPKKGDPAADRFTPRLQAHCSMRIC